MNNDNTPKNDTIELVDIDDLRTAFGGEGLEVGADVDADADATVAPGSTVMCSGWYVDK